MNKDNNQRINISSQFLRSVNLESDYGRLDSLDNYILQTSTRNLLNTLSHHIVNSQQRAFTITGPYGGGKSSLALLLASLVSCEDKLRKKAKKLIGPNENIIKTGFKASKGWLVLPVVGRKDSVENGIKKVIENKAHKKISRATQNILISELIKLAEDRPSEGVLLIIDELGKFLENATLNEGDIYFYQLLAEAASRSKGKLVIIGILHQSFEQYAYKLGKSIQEEWSKIQGRYIDLPLVSSTDEVVELIGKAIETHGITSKVSAVERPYKTIATTIQKRRPNLSSNFSNELKKCWPLSPVVAALIGPVSRKKYSQNERSIFSFLTSAEPHGFSEYSLANTFKDLYGADQYWDYLKSNFEQSIILSSDGHRWAIANDAIERTESREGCTQKHLKIIKSIALIDLFKNNSGLYPEDNVIQALKLSSSNNTKEILHDLARWSVIIFKKHLQSWAIFSGSDFDIDQAINDTRQTIGELDKHYLASLLELNYVVAKRHYHQTGYIRWMTKNLCGIDELEYYLSNFVLEEGAIGEFILVVPDLSQTIKENEKQINEQLKKIKNKNILIGLLQNAQKLNELGLELVALEQVQKNYRELEGDAVARKEIESRISSLKVELSLELAGSFDKVAWHSLNLDLDFKPTVTPLTSIASEMADKLYNHAPKIFNELINKDAASSNVSSARKLLMYRMLDFSGQENLGFDNYSAEAGLFYTVIKNNNLYEKTEQGYEFITPEKKHPFNRLWQATDKLFGQKEGLVKLSDIYQLWQKPPFGIKKHILPIISLMYFLSKKYGLIFYFDEKYIPELSELYVDEWLIDPRRISFKAFSLSEDKKELIKFLAQELNKHFNRTVEQTSLDAARTLVQLVMSIPRTSLRTRNISDTAIKFREVIVRANDPNKVLFTDLPATFEEQEPKRLINIIIKNIKELTNDFPALIENGRRIFYRLIDHNGEVEDLNKRAENIIGLGNFNDNTFINQIANYKENSNDIEGILNVTINKDPREWTDIDREEAINNLGLLCDKFRKIEVMNSVRNIDPTRTSFAFMYSDKASNYSSVTYDIAHDKKEVIKNMSSEVVESLKSKGIKKEEIMAVLAEACNEIIEVEKMADGDKNG